MILPITAHKSMKIPRNHDTIIIQNRSTSKANSLFAHNKELKCTSTKLVDLHPCLSSPPKIHSLTPYINKYKVKAATCLRPHSSAILIFPIIALYNENPLIHDEPNKLFGIVCK